MDGSDVESGRGIFPLEVFEKICYYADRLTVGAIKRLSKTHQENVLRIEKLTFWNEWKSQNIPLWHYCDIAYKWCVRYKNLSDIPPLTWKDLHIMRENWKNLKKWTVKYRKINYSFNDVTSVDVMANKIVLGCKCKLMVVDFKTNYITGFTYDEIVTVQICVDPVYESWGEQYPYLARVIRKDGCYMYLDLVKMCLYSPSEENRKMTETISTATFPVMPQFDYEFEVTMKEVFKPEVGFIYIWRSEIVIYGERDQLYIVINDEIKNFDCGTMISEPSCALLHGPAFFLGTITGYIYVYNIIDKSDLMDFIASNYVKIIPPFKQQCYVVEGIAVVENGPNETPKIIICSANDLFICDFVLNDS